ncbi:unnamed protein product [Discosporangium mesarthrocarpum]
MWVGLAPSSFSFCNGLTTPNCQMPVCFAAHAPVSKALALATAIASLVVLSNKSQDRVSLVASRVFGRNPQWWRIFSSLLPLGTVSELMCSLHLIRTFRLCERHMGSAKFGSFVFIVAVFAKSIELALCLSFPSLRTPTGPVAVLAALLTAFYAYIPEVGPILFKIGSHNVSSKTFTHAWALWLIFRGGWHSGVLGVTGLILAIIYFADVLPLQRFRVPGQPIFALLRPLLDSEDPREERRRQMMQMMEAQRRQQGLQGGVRVRGERLVPPAFQPGMPGNS